MSNLPFHAAGEGTEKPDSENVFDYAICFVTISLTAIKMTQNFTAHLKGILNDGVLVVSMPTTPQLNDLKAKEELTSIEEAVDIVSINLINSKKVDVVQRLGEHGIVHFICHGKSKNEDFSFSALILGHREAKRLTVKELNIFDFGKARITYLSACSTAENAREKLSDEFIHLVNAFQFVEFSHVIATF